MVQFESYLRRVLCKTRLIFPRINGPIVCRKNNMKMRKWEILAATKVKMSGSVK